MLLLPKILSLGAFLGSHREAGLVPDSKVTLGMAYKKHAIRNNSLNP